MKWNKYTIETTTAAEDYLSSALMDLGIEGVQIEDNVPLTKEDQAEMFIDFLPELPPDEGISYVSFYLEDNGQDDTELLKQVKTTIEEMRNVEHVCGRGGTERSGEQASRIGHRNRQSQTRNPP